jgi:spermidine synthase
MKPTLKIATTTTPDGEMLTLVQHDADFSMKVGCQELMTSRAHESELELARLGCARIAARQNPTVLIGGLGMGYTLRQTLDLLQPDATVVVSELIPDVVQWNRDYLGELTNHPLRDPRVVLKVCDVMSLIQQSEHAFDAIMLDVDNGPEALTAAGNDRLYSRQGLQACMHALHAKGCLAIWSGAIDNTFERRLKAENLFFRLFHVPVYKGGKALARCVWLIASDPRSLPPEEAKGKGKAKS